MIHAFLVIGQSNAAGRGFLEDAPPIDTCNGRLKVLRYGRWQTMFRPINPDRASSGISLAESFAKCYADANPDIEVGIVSCADGGTELNQWMPGEALFDNAVNCARLAMRSANLVGVLWHQGESDCTPENSAVYYEKLKTIMTQLRLQLGLPELPIVVGGLGDYLVNCTRFPEVANYQDVNQQLIRFSTEDPHCEYVDAHGLGANPDNLHFSTAALYEFGRRYFQAFQKFDTYKSCITEKNTDHVSAQSEMELL